MIHKLYPIKANDTYNNIVVETFYDLGNKYEGRARGYYAHVFPAHVSKLENGLTRTVSFAYTGYRALILEVKRKSNSAELKADKIASHDLLYSMIERVCKENDLHLA